MFQRTDGASSAGLGPWKLNSKRYEGCASCFPESASLGSRELRG